MGQDAAQIRPWRSCVRGGEELGAHARERLAGRRVAITGAGGFIGSRVVAELIKGGAEVVFLGSRMPRRQPELRLLSSLCGCDSLVHLNYVPPAATTFTARLRHEIEINLSETVRLLEAAEPYVGHICFASSTAVYSPTASRVTEDSPTGQRVSPYALAKLQQEACVRRWSRRTGRPSTILRLSTVYGPGETVRRAIPRFISAVLAGTAPRVDGRGERAFDPIYVGDVAGAFACAVETRADGTFNVGCGHAWTPRRVAQLVNELCGTSFGVVENSDASERGGPVVDTSRATRHLGFSAATPLEAGLREEIAWMRGELLGRTA